MAFLTNAAEAEPVILLQVPGRGIQPQALVDAQGQLHVLYLAGSPEAADIFETTWNPKTRTFAKPLRVNQESGSGVAIGTIRGAQGAWGRDGRMHVVWNARVPDADGKSHMEVCYTRSDVAGGKFEPERNLMRAGKNLDGGATIAADGKGNVHVLWHAMPANASPEPGHGEEARTIYIATSQDDGASFTRDAPCSDKVAGICGCCSMRAATLVTGELVALYRGADGTSRSMQIIRSSDRAIRFKAAEIHPWRINVCPMSSSSLLPTPQGFLAAWETDATIWVAGMDGDPLIQQKVSGASCKHPSLARNDHGEILITWARGTGWQRGGTLEWCVLNPKGGVISASGTEKGGDADLSVPVWSFPAAAFVKDVGFVVVH